MNNSTIAILLALISLVINGWIIKQQRAGITIEQKKKQTLERVSYAIILVAIFVLTFL